MIQILVGLGFNDILKNTAIGVIIGVAILLGAVALKKFTGVDVIDYFKKRAQARPPFRDGMKINTPVIHHMTLGPEAPVLSQREIRIVEASRGRVIMEVSGLRITLESVLIE